MIALMFLSLSCLACIQGSQQVKLAALNNYSVSDLRILILSGHFAQHRISPQAQSSQVFFSIIISGEFITGPEHQYDGLGALSRKTAFEDMGWAEVAPGRWQRLLGENESMIKMIGDSGCEVQKDLWSIAATARFTARHENAKPLLHILKDGWRALRFRHPSVATTATADCIDYRVPDSEDLERWVDETFVVIDSENASFNHVITNLTPKRFATCYYLAKQSGIILHLSHWRTDGIGAFHLLGALFAAAADYAQHDGSLDLNWGHETARLVPHVEQAMSLPHWPTERIQRATKIFLDTLENQKGALEVPFEHQAIDNANTPTENGTRTIDRSFSREQTAGMLAACDRLVICVHAALHASVTAAAYRVASPVSRDKHHSSTLRHSLRPHLPQPYDGLPGAAGLFTAGYIVKVPASHSWLDNAKYYDHEYNTGATPDLLFSRRQYAAVMKGILANMVPPSSPLSGVDMSWVPDAEGLVMTRYAKGGTSFEVEEIGLGIEVLSRQLYVFGWIFNGQLSLRLVCNRVFYSENFGGKVLELVKESMLSNLSLQGRCT